jgi:hypothetical protein
MTQLQASLLFFVTIVGICVVYGLAVAYAEAKHMEDDDK